MQDSTPTDRTPALALSLGVLLVGIGLTGWATWQWQHTLEAQSQQAFNQITERIEETIRQRVAQTQRALQSAHGLTVTDNGVGPVAFRQFVAAIDLERQYPGVRGIGYIERIAPRDLPAFKDRQQRAVATDFQVQMPPADSRGPSTDQAHYIVSLIEPLARNRPALGIDLAAEPARHQAIEQALTSGQSTASPPLVLAQDARRRQGVLLLQPVYRPGASIGSPAQRRDAFMGTFYAAIVLDELLWDLPIVGDTRVDLRVVDARSAAAVPLFSFTHSQRDLSRPRRHTARHVLEIGQRSWELEFHSNGQFDQTHDLRGPWALGFGGTLLTVLLSLTVWQAATGRQRAEALAGRMTQELERLANVVKLTSNAAVIMDAQQHIVWVNEGFTRMYGHTLEQARGQTMSQLVGTEQTPADQLTRLLTVHHTGHSGRVQVINRTRDGRTLSVETEVQAVYGPNGDLSYFVELTQDVTQLRQTMQDLQTALRETDSLLRTIHLHAIVSVADRRGRIVDVNEAFCRISGFGRDELIGQDHRIVNSRCHPRDFWIEMWQQIANGQPWRGEICNRAKDGTLYWVDSIIAPFAGPDGRIEKYISIRQDITQRKEIELRLRSSQALLDRTGRIAGVGGWQYDVATRQMQWSEQNSRLYDLPPGQPLATDDPLAHIPEPGKSQVSKAARAAMENGEPWDLEVEAITATGRRIWIRSVGEAEFEDGKLVRLAGASQDITVQRRARAELARTTRMLRSVLDAATEFSIIATDPNLKITLFNTGAERMLGFRSEDMVGKLTPMHFHDHDEVASAARDLANELGEPVAELDVFLHPLLLGLPRDWTYIRKDGQRLRVSLVITPLQGEEGEVIGYLGMALDVTHRQRYEASLRQSMEAAEQASLAKSQFLANMSHEIRTPMNAILGMLRLLQRTPLSARQRDYANKTEGAARALLALLNDILDFSKVEAGKMALDPRPFEMERWLRDLAVILSASADDKPVEVLFDIDADLPPRLIGDDLRLQQVLINLGGNAIKFTTQGEIVISLHRLPSSGPMVRLRVAVRDTGIGIAPKALQQIFEGFSQAESSTTRRFGGTGLGLTIARRLVDMMGGQLQVRSELGQGSEFSFDIDLATPDEPPLPVHRTADSAALRVMVVDDHPTARALIAAQAHCLGWQVDLASGGHEALARYDLACKEGHPHDAVIIDRRMPELDGRQTCQALRSRPDAKGLRIVMISARGFDDSDDLDAPESPLRADAHLVKPFTPEQLRDAVTYTANRQTGTAPQGNNAATAMQRLAGLHLLLVEDNANNRQIALELLRDEGASVSTASNGQEGVQAVLAADGGFDVVLMDVQMPVLDGLQASARLHDLLGERTPPIIAMTAHATEADRQAALAAGMVAHVIKPFDFDALVALLRQHAGRSIAPAPDVAIEAEELPAEALALARDLEIDLMAGWARLGRRIDVYGRLLQSFCKDLDPALDRIDGWWQMGEAEPLKAWLHTVKGLASTLGHTRLATTLAQAEQCLARLGLQDGLPPWWQVTRQAVAQARPELRRLEQALQPTQAPGPAVQRPSPTSLQTDLPALLSCLEHSDMRAVALHETLYARIGGWDDPDWQALSDRISQLDFRGAAAACQRLLATCTEE